MNGAPVCTRTEEHDMADTLYARLGGYDGIAAVTDALLPRLQQDSRLGPRLAPRELQG